MLADPRFLLIEGRDPVERYGHTRRQFEQAERAEPRLVAVALDRIATFYQEEAGIRKQGLAAEAKLTHRGAVTKPLVEHFFAWLK